MTFLLSAVAVALLGTAGWLLARVVGWQRIRVEANLRQLENYSVELDSPRALRGRPLNEALANQAERLGRAAIQRVPRLKSLSRGDLAAAGLYELTPEIAHGYRLIFTATLLLLVPLTALLQGGLSPLLWIVLIAAAVVVGWLLPGIIIKNRGRRRLDQIDRELPDLIDLLVATVEAGMGFGGSLRLVAGRFEGPLGEELRLTLQQQNLGISNEDALTDMAERANTPSMRNFVRTVIRAETLGVSIGQIMRNLTAEMRLRRRQAMREKVQKAPIKLLFPLLFLIFPALLIAILYPAVFTISHSLG